MACQLNGSDLSNALLYHNFLYGEFPKESCEISKLACNLSSADLGWIEDSTKEEYTRVFENKNIVTSLKTRGILTKVTLRFMECLKLEQKNTLNISEHIDIEESQVIRFLARSPKIKNLELPKGLLLTSGIFNAIAKLCPDLDTLKIEGARFHSTQDLNEGISLIADRLVSVDLTNVNTVDDQTIKILCANSQHLSCIKIQNCQITGAILPLLLNHESLNSLYIGGNLLSVEDVSSITENARKFKMLVIDPV